MTTEWPIVTDDSFQDANPLLDVCYKRVKEHVLPFVESGVIPVIAGFVGRTQNGRVTTLGRGGSDTTAFILAKALEADELILVTDAEGIMTADPKVISNSQRIPEIDVKTLVGLADSGTKFIHRKALRYKEASVRVRVIRNIHGDLNVEGTVITGALSGDLGAELASPFSCFVNHCCRKRCFTESSSNQRISRNCRRTRRIVRAIFEQGFNDTLCYRKL